MWVQLPIPSAGVPDYRMTDEGGAPVACQAEPSGTGADDRLWLSWIVRDLPAGAQRRYRIQPVHGTPDEGVPPEATDHGPGVVLEELPDGKLGVHVDGTHLTTYNFGSDVVRPYFFPLIGPTGANVVRSWPMVEGVVGETNDHPHHKGLYVAHGDVNGTDNWSEGAESLHHAPHRLRPPRLRAPSTAPSTRRWSGSTARPASCSPRPAG